MSDNIGVLIIVICVALSAFFSATETAFNSVNKMKLKSMEEKGDSVAALVLLLLSKYENLLSTILIGNNIVNILATSVATVLCVKHFGEDAGSALSTLIITIVVLIFGEITPKTIAKGSAESFCKFAAPILQVFMIVLTPLNWLFGLWQKLTLKIFKPKDDPSVTDEEILTIVRTAEEEGEIDKQESTLIHNSIDFNDTLTEDILTPRVDIEAVEENCSKKEVANVFASTGYSRIPVYAKDIDHIIGVLYQKDFYNKIYSNDGTVKSIIRPVVFTTEHRPIGQLFRELQKNKIHMAVVIDEYGGTLGIVTMEDILEELVGEIWDEHEEIEQEITKVTEKEYLVAGSTNYEKFCETMGIELDEEQDVLTVSGWLIDRLQHLPKIGDQVDFENLHMDILEIGDHVIEKIRVEITDAETAGENKDEMAGQES